MNIRTIIAISLLNAFITVADAQGNDEIPRTSQPTPDEDTTKVVVSGNVADEATRQVILEKLVALYGARNIVDKTSTGGVIPPPKWNQAIEKLLSNNIKKIHNGQIKIDGTQITLKGKVANTTQHQLLSSALTVSLDPSYTIINALTIEDSQQEILDVALSNRIIEFETGSSNITKEGQGILDDIALTIKKTNIKKIKIIGHTDNTGSRQSNLELSLARANAVRSYFSEKGIPTSNLTPIGMGPNSPVRSNHTPQGRAQNRRIEFRVLE